MIPETRPGGPTAAALPDLTALRALAHRHGFDDLAVTDAAPHTAAGLAFQDWLARGAHADMAWLAREPERRYTPQRVLPDARAVLTLAVNYHPEHSVFRPPSSVPPCPSPLAGRVAAYATGEDYHRVLEPALKAMIAELLQADATRHYRYYVDTGPVLERAFADRAGLGFIGRSTLLIHPRFGTYVLLATIITDAPYTPTPPAPGTCGQCRRCLDVCPTGALRTPHELDARLCISYLTIENRGPIPRHLRPAIGDWLFGCDLCQEVCPYNAQTPPGTHPRIARAALAGAAPDLREVLALRTPEAFSERFSKSPLKRARREGLLRNAAVVAGNRPQQAELRPALRAALADPSPLVRGHAVWALDRHGDRDPLQTLAAVESDPFVLAELAAAHIE